MKNEPIQDPYFSPERVRTAIDFIANKIEASGEDYSCLIAPVRGGLIPGTMLSHKLKLPVFPVLFSLRDFKMSDGIPLELIRHINQSENRKALIIEDIVDSGDTMVELLQQLDQKWQTSNKPARFDIAALVENTEAPVYVDFSYMKIQRSTYQEWLKFYWEY